MGIFFIIMQVRHCIPELASAQKWQDFGLQPMKQKHANNSPMMNKKPRSRDASPKKKQLIMILLWVNVNIPEIAKLVQQLGSSHTHLLVGSYILIRD